MNAEGLLVFEEGRRNVAYPDSRGIPTNGIGHKDASMIIGVTTWSDAKVDQTFADDFAHARDGIAASLPWFRQLDEVRQAYVVSMAFQMGVHGVLEFHHTLAAIAAQRWVEAAQGIRSSDWHEQTKGRAERCEKAILTGQWQC